MTKFFFSALILLNALFLKAQQLVPLSSNPHLVEYNQTHLNHVQAKTQSIATPTLNLPFFDEFSYAGPYPDSAKWMSVSKSVYVNRTKAIAPPTLGVATFDGLNKYGYPYLPGSTGNGLPSDTLMSLPIRLDSMVLQHLPLTPSDSVYLSFYYQPQGYWEAPESNDILALDFYNPQANLWNRIWTNSSASINNLSNFNDTSFYLVMIPVTDVSYFKKGFKFRFTNLSSACGDVDHWHLDEVYLNSNRSVKDTVFSDVSFVYDLKSPLKNYTQMPWRQYNPAIDMRPNLPAVFRNNNNIRNSMGYNNSFAQVNVGTAYSFYDGTGNLLHFTNNGSNNVANYDSIGFCKDPFLSNPALTYTYTALSAPDSFTVKFSLNAGSGDTILRNDTISFHQKFENYYAYDDGSAEAAVYVNGANGKTAARYTLNAADTLRAMDIFFNPIIDILAISATQFTLCVWADNGGIPSAAPIYSLSTAYAYFQNNGQRANLFQRYQLKKPVYLVAGQTFYIGISQAAAESLNVGFDLNNDYRNNMFYFLPGSGLNQWYQIPFSGSLMMRPVFGDSLHTVNILKAKEGCSFLSLYPNPAANKVFLRSDKKIKKVIITDILGKSILEETISLESIDTSPLSDGIYFVKAITEEGMSDSRKLIINR